MRSFFFGNYFYGICAAALAVEASLQQGYGLNPFYFYVLIFCATVWFYTLAYISDVKIIGTNERTNWYSSHARFVAGSQCLLLVILAGVGLYMIAQLWADLLFITARQWVLVLLFPL